MSLYQVASIWKTQSHYPFLEDLNCRRCHPLNYFFSSNRHLCLIPSSKYSSFSPLCFLRTPAEFHFFGGILPFHSNPYFHLKVNRHRLMYCSGCMIRSHGMKLKVLIGILSSSLLSESSTFPSVPSLSLFDSQATCWG